MFSTIFLAFLEIPALNCSNEMIQSGGECGATTCNPLIGCKKRQSGGCDDIENRFEGNDITRNNESEFTQREREAGLKCRGFLRLGRLVVTVP